MALATGLTRSELDVLVAAAPYLAGWCVLPHCDPHGEAMAVILPADDAPDRPSFLVHREGDLLRLDECRDEGYTRLGAYPALTLLIAALQSATVARAVR